MAKWLHIPISREEVADLVDVLDTALVDHLWMLEESGSIHLEAAKSGQTSYTRHIAAWKAKLEPFHRHGDGEEEGGAT